MSLDLGPHTPTGMPFRPGFQSINDPEPGEHADMWAYPDDPDIILRVSSVSDAVRFQHDATTEQYVGLVKKLFAEVREDYHIPVVEFRPVITNVRNQFALVVDRVPGEVFEGDRYRQMTAEQKTAAWGTLGKVYAYLHKKIDTGEAFVTNHLADIGQYVYDEGQKDFEFVDVDPFAEAPRGRCVERVLSEAEFVTDIMNTAANLAEDAEVLADWQQRCHDLLDLISERNQYVIPEEHKQRIIEMASRGDMMYPDELEAMIVDETNALPENQGYVAWQTDQKQALIRHMTQMLPPTPKNPRGWW